MISLYQLHPGNYERKKRNTKEGRKEGGGVKLIILLGRHMNTNAIISDQLDKAMHKVVMRRGARRWMETLMEILVGCDKVVPRGY